MSIHSTRCQSCNEPIAPGARTIKVDPDGQLAQVCALPKCQAYADRHDVVFGEPPQEDSDKEMQGALEADGEKLRGLTGEDHGPYFVDDDPETEK